MAGMVSHRGWSSTGFLLMAIVAAGRLNVPAAPLPQAHPESRVVSLTLHAAVNAQGRDSFSYEGKNIAPVIRVLPGHTLKIDYENDLPLHSTESCAISPCKNMTNLHFHGLEISPQSPQDDVIDMMAMPGDTLHYAVKIPADHPPGLFWYHTHPHGESHRQALDGMSGAIVIEGYPVDPEGDRVDQTAAYVGTVGLFEAHGFERVMQTAGRSGGKRRWLVHRRLT